MFCDMAAADPSHDREGLVLFRGRCNYAILNLYPYTTGHTLVIPYAHAAQLSQLGTDTLGEMMALAQKINAALEKTYHPDGYNLGMNIGKAAGAGVADHVHLHFLPRWESQLEFHDGDWRNPGPARGTDHHLRQAASLFPRVPQAVGAALVGARERAGTRAAPTAGSTAFAFA